MRRKPRKGVYGASARERWQLMAAEKMACKSAVESECNKRCAEHAIGLADCSDISVRAVSMYWWRNGGPILASFGVRLAPDDALYVYNWRIGPSWLPKSIS